jgi:hypothetical protein
MLLHVPSEAVDDCGVRLPEDFVRERIICHHKHRHQCLF